MPGTGGKKGAQRTKGNVKPSSSSQAAELLAQSGLGRTGFIGFGNTASPAYVPASETFDDADNSLDSDFRMVLRKLSKRDSTTKIKALQEFAGLCQEKDEECLKGVLPFWPRIYNKMSIDVDHRVREATQQAMTTLVSRVRRNIAPYLKSMMGCWMLSQCDTYPTVSTSATQAFQAAFPPAKQTGAIEFCKVEVAEYLVDNLTTQTAASLGDPKSNTPEEMESRYNRVVTCSFLALRKLLLSLQKESLNAIAGHLRGLLNDPKFWKFAKSTIGSVKSGFFAFCGSLSQTLPDVSQEYVAKLSPLILHSIDVSDPVIGSALWEAVLSFVKYLPECWNHISWAKAFWPKLRTLLEKGCYGNASVVGPNLLPLLSQIPENLTGDPKMFYTEFFSCFKLGLSVEVIQQSNSESSAMVSAFFECCQFAVKKQLDAGTHLEIVNVIVMDQVLPIVESSLIESKSTLHKTPLYGAFAQLTNSLEKSNNGEKVASLCYKSLLQTVEEILISDSPQLHTFTSRLLTLVSDIVRPNAKIKAKTEKVKFADEVSLEELKLEPVELVGCRQEFINSLLCATFRKCYVDENSEFLDIFSRMFMVHSSTESVTQLLAVLGCKTGDNVYVTFMCDVIIPWMQRTQDHVLSLLDVVFTCLPNTGDSHALTTLTQLTQCLTSPLLLCTLIRKGLEVNKSVPSVTSWLKSSALTDRVVSLGEEICNWGGDNRDDERLEQGWSLITLVLSSTDQDEPLFDGSCVKRVLEVVLKTLQQLAVNSGKDKIDNAVTFVARAAKAFFQNLKVFSTLESVENLMLALFSVYINAEFNITALAREDTQEAIDSGLQVIIKQTGAYMREGGFFEQAARLVQKSVLQTQSMDSLKHTESCVKQLLTTVQMNMTESTHTDPTVQAIVDTLFVANLEDNFSQVVEYVTLQGILSLTKMESKRPTTTLSQLLYTTLFNTQLLTFRTSGHLTLTSRSKVTLGTDDETRILDCLSGYIVAMYWIQYDRKTSGLSPAIDDLKVKVTDLIVAMDTESQKKVLKTALSRSDECGGLSAVTVATLLDVLQSSSSAVILSDDAVLDRCSSLSASSLHTLQCITRYVSDDIRFTVAEILQARFITTPTDSATEIDGGVGLLGVLNMTLPLLGGRSEVKDIYESVLSQIMLWKQESEDLMLFACELDDATVEKVSVNIEVMKFVQLYVSRYPQDLSDVQWDFVLCSTVAWIQSVTENESLLTSELSVSMFTIVASQLLADVVSCIDHIRVSPSGYPSNLITEWDEFFSEGVFSILLPLYVRSVGKWQQTCGSGLHDCVLSSLGLAVSHCPKQHAVNNQLPAKLVAEELSPLPDTLLSLLNTLCPLMLCSSASVQTSAFHLLNSVMGEIPSYAAEDKDEMEKVKDEDKRDDESCTPPHALDRVCLEGGAAMDIILTDCRFEECVLIQPNSDEYKYALGYLLSWKLILKIFKSSKSEVRARYAVYFKDTGIVDHLLAHLYQLMPDNPASVYFDSTPQSTLQPTAPSSTDVIQRLSCGVYRQCLETIPALVRQWWMGQDKQTTSYIDKFTKRNASPLLCHSEITSVQTTDEELDGIEIKTRPKIREVIAMYTMSEVSVEVVISLPENYPLGSITVVSDKKVGVTQSQWDRWLLHLNIFLQHQNGSIIEGLKLWKKNIDKRFEGVDDCMICFSVLHGTNFQLPRLQCRTCKKKYHSACLYKWFSTSHNSTCPLCRNLF